MAQQSNSCAIRTQIVLFLVEVLAALLLLCKGLIIENSLVLLILMGKVVLVCVSLRVAACVWDLLDLLHIGLDLVDLYVSVAFPEEEEIVIALLLIEMINAFNDHVLSTNLFQWFLKKSVYFIGNHYLLIARWCFLNWFRVISWFFLGLGEVGGKKDQSFTPVALMLADMRLFYHLKNDRYIIILN